MPFVVPVPDTIQGRDITDGATRLPCGDIQVEGFEVPRSEGVDRPPGGADHPLVGDAPGEVGRPVHGSTCFLAVAVIPSFCFRFHSLSI